MCPVFSRGMGQKTAVAKIKQATRNFAKRQITWYKKMPYIHWLMLDASPHYPAIADKMLEVLRERQFIENERGIHSWEHQTLRHSISRIAS